MRVEDRVEKIHACSIKYKFIRKEQTVHPAVPNRGTLVDASVDVYSIHTDKSSPKFLVEGHIGYYTTVRGPTSC